MIRAGAIILLGSWLPLFAVGMMDPAANPIGLGLLALAGSLAGMIVLAFSLLAALIRLLR